MTTDVRSNKVDIPYSEKLQFGDILLDESREYKSNFWNNYNIISPDEDSENLFKSIDYSKKNNHENQSNSLMNFLHHLKYEMTLTWTSIRTNPYTLTYVNSTLDIQQNGMTSQKPSWSLAYSLFYQIKPNFFIGYANESKISKTGITSYDLVISHEFNLNPNGRPIFISPQVNLGYQEIDYLIGVYNVEEDFKIGGKSFNSDKVDIFLSQRGFRIKPNISLIIEKSRKLNFLISVGSNFQLNKKNGALFHEKNDFFLFRKKSFLKNGQQNLLIENSQGKLLENTITIGAGISFKFL